MRTAFFMLALGIFALKRSPAQTTLEFDQWTTAHGLSQVSVFAITQDREGFLWFATENGLNQFDGYQFTHYTRSFFDSNSLSDQLVYIMAEDEDGILWIGCFGGGLNRYDRRTERFTHYRHDPDDPHSLSSDFVTTVYISPHQPGTIWAGTDRGGLNRFDTKSQTFVSYKYNPQDPNSPGNDRIYALNGDDEGNIWIGTRKGLTRFDPVQNQFKRYTAKAGDPHALSDDEVWHIFKDRDGILWLSTSNGLTRCDPRRPEDPFTVFRHDDKDPGSLPHLRVWATCDDDSLRKDFLWVGTHQGLAHMNKKTGLCDAVYRHDPADPRSLGHDQVWALFKDRQENIWLGSFGGGVNRVNRSKEQFNHFHADARHSGSIRDNEIWALAEDRSGSVWVGHRKGVDVLAPNGQRTESIPNTNAEGGFPKLDGTRVQAILEDSRGNVWLGTDGAGMYRFERTRKKLIQFKNIPNDTNSLSNDFVSFIFEPSVDKDGVLWIGTNDGLNRFDPLTEKFRRYQQDSAAANSVSHPRVRCIAEDKAGRLWVGTYGGVDRFDKKKGTFVHHKHDPLNANSLSEDRVWAICETRDGVLWIGTHIGLDRYDALSNSFEIFTVREGLPSNEIYGILEDPAGRLWMSTGHGLSRYDPRTRSFTNYFEEDGIQNNEFNGAVFATGRDGRLFFGGINGFTAFHAGRIRPNPDVPPVVITAFREFDKPVFKDRSIRDLPSLELSYDENFFGFEFSALSYHNPLKNQYRYKMQGFDADWVNSGSRRYATYTNLDPGAYTFRVLASNSDGVWNEEGASLRVVIRPPWWKTWWFRMIAAMIIVGILWGVYHLRITRLLEIERMRTRIASDLHDDIGATLTRIAVGSELIRNTQEDGKIRLNAERIGQLSREVIRTFSDIVWSIDARNDKAGDLIARLRDTAYQILSPKEIGVQFTFQGISDEKTIPVDIRQNIFLICKEAFHNAVKYSGASRVDVRFDNASDVLTVTIHDNGSGLPADLAASGNGLRNMRLRAERIGGRIAWSNDKGLKIILTVRSI